MMEDDVILKVENLSKQYRLGLVGTGTISHDLNRFFARIRGKDDPYLKIGESNDRSTKGTSEYVWALKDINFEVKRGEVLGIIGKNGAGKSTLLKILSKVTGPTTGAIKSKGRIASLLEVGTGFHPEMTGKENIFLNGAILGMTKKEITSKLDEIIEFSGCERYIDTPVKRYSSGMKVRLAFAVAAFLQPDILVVDEVLAVGDAEFQKKAIGKMQDISSQGGRTVLFVSHDMAAIQSLCSRVLVLENGKKLDEGKTENMIFKYLSFKDLKFKNPVFKNLDCKIKNYLKIVKCSLSNNNGIYTNSFNANEKIFLKFEIKNKGFLKIKYSGLWIIVNEIGENLVAGSSGLMQSLFFNENTKEISCSINPIGLVPGKYKIRILLHYPKQKPFDDWVDAINFEILNHDINNTGYNYSKNWNPKLYLEHKWK
jgi:lipopolysaccharide transport system ATP-binding protein